MVDQQAIHTKIQAAFPNLTVYYRPTDKITLRYPCITYAQDIVTPTLADNVIYSLTTSYTVTIMSLIPGIDTRSIFSIPRVQQTTTFISDDIVHDVFKIVMSAI